MKNKEQIIDDEFSDGMVDEITGYKLQYVKDSMDEWAKEQAISFMKFIDAQHNQQVSDNDYIKMYSEFIKFQSSHQK